MTKEATLEATKQANDDPTDMSYALNGLWCTVLA